MLTEQTRQRYLYLPKRINGEWHWLRKYQEKKILKPSWQGLRLVDSGANQEGTIYFWEFDKWL